MGTRPSQKPCSMESAMELRKAWHESDKLFFTKKDLQDVSNQLNRRYSTRQKSDSKRLVSVKGLSGSRSTTNQERKLRYSCYEQLDSAVESRRIELAEAFFPLQIEHFMLARASDTKQPTSPEYVENPVAGDEALKTTLRSWKIAPKFQGLETILTLLFNTHKVTKVVGIASGSI
ncbi:unnamed protein product [Penicillium discolor]